MAWKEMNVSALADSLGINASEVLEKQKIIQFIVKAREERKLSQATLAKEMGITQSRIAQIESGIGTSKVTFDVLLGVLKHLGFDYKVVLKRTE